MAGILRELVEVTQSNLIRVCLIHSNVIQLYESFRASPKFGELCTSPVRINYLVLVTFQYRKLFWLCLVKMWKKGEKKKQSVMGNFPNLSFHCLVMTTAVCWFGGNLQLEETRLHISSSGIWMMAFSMVLWSQFYTRVMAALNYSHNIMGKRINPSLPSFISKALGKWGGDHLPQRNKLMVGDMSVSEKAAGSRLCWNALKC